MITKQTTDYSKLFEKASIALGAETEAEYITSLNEYFRNIVDLAQIDLQYTVLPLDEETFDIDANTREIKVPASFKNGVGVQGDQVAEILYFSIDRYFDATDLNTQNIYIEWRNASGDEGLSKEYHRDLTTQPNKIIFGWPLTAEITDTYGTVEFAVRFYSIKEGEGDNKQVIYSFATKPQRITINKTMDFEITDNSIPVYDAKEMIITRFVNSEATDEESTVDAPTFLLDLVEGYEYNISDNDGFDLYDDRYALKVQAYGTGRITYYLEYADIGSDTWVGQTYKDPHYELTKDTVRNVNKTYYEQVIDEKTGKVSGYTVFDGELPTASNTTIYEKFGLYYATDAGKYRLRAQNRVGANYANQLSKIMEFPGPVTPSVNTEQQAIQLTVNGDGTTTAPLNIPVIGSLPSGTNTYKWTADAADSTTISTASSYLATDEGYYYATVTNERNTRSKTSLPAVFRVTLPTQQPTITQQPGRFAPLGSTLRVGINKNELDYDEIIVHWYEVANVADGINPENDGDPVSTTSTASGDIAFTPESSGVYYAKLIAVLNTFPAEPVYSEPCAVTD